MATDLYRKDADRCCLCMCVCAREGWKFFGCRLLGVCVRFCYMYPVGILGKWLSCVSVCACMSEYEKKGAYTVFLCMCVCQF